MNFSIQKLPKSQVEILIEVPTEEFAKYIGKAISDLGKDLKMQGFRKGKAPREVIRQEIGQEKILREAAERAIKENYIKVVLENKLEVLGQPKIEILKIPAPHRPAESGTGAGARGNPFCFRAKAAVFPEIKLPDYRKTISQIQKREISFKEEEIEDTLKWFQKSRAKFSQIEREAKIGDFVEIEYNSPEIENGKIQKDGFLLGQGQLIPGFEEKLEGMKTGEAKEFSLKFPENHSQKNLAGKGLNFKAKMLSVQKVELPEINDQFAKSLGYFENLNSLKESISQGIKMEKERRERERIRQEILNKITKEISWEIPEILIEAEKEEMIEDLKKQVQDRLQINFGEYLTKTQRTEAEMRESLQREAEKRIKNSLVLREIAKRENIKVSEEEVKEKISQLFKNYPDMEKTKGGVDLEKLKAYYEEAIKNEKTLQFFESLVSK